MRFRQESSFLRARASQGMYSVKLMPHHIGLCPNVLQNTVQMLYPQLAVLGSDGRFHIGIGEEQGREMAGSRTPMSRWMAAWRKPLCHCGKTRRSREGAVWCMVSPPAVQDFCGAAVSRGNTGRAGQPEGKVRKQDCCRSAAGDRKGRVTTAGAGAGSGGRKMTGERKVPLPFPGNNAMSARAYSEADTRRSRRRS